MVTVRLPEDLKARIDDARGDVPRERWVRRALEQALGQGLSIGEAVADERGPAPTRAPVREEMAAKAKGPDWPSHLPPPVAEVPLPKIAPRHWSR